MNSVFSLWLWDVPTIVGMALLTLLFLWLHQFRFSKKLLPFCIALVLMVICLISPLGLLSAHYLFSAHMAAHVILLLIVAPLLVLSLPEKLPVPLQNLFGFFTAHPWLAWFTGVGIMWFWHIPVVFNLMMQHSNPWHSVIHHFETISLLISGMIFSFPVLKKRTAMHPLAGVVYLASACVFCSLLGLMITFAPAGFYYHYLASNDPYFLNPIIQKQWHISQADDQQAAGLIMWVPCCMVYLTGALLLLKSWFNAPDGVASSETFNPKHIIS